MKRLTPRLWGEWETFVDASGSCVVLLVSRDERRPHLYVFADPLPDRRRTQANRIEMCRLLTAWLNGGERPAWLGDFYRRSPNVAECLTGAMLLAAGPWLRSPGQQGPLRQSGAPEAQRGRATLLDVLLGAPGQP